MRSNRWAADCHECKTRVPKRGGVLKKEEDEWRVYHNACYEEGSPQVVETYFPSTGNYYYQNSRGKCIDAPCCGCCSA